MQRFHSRHGWYAPVADTKTRVSLVLTIVCAAAVLAAQGQPAGTLLVLAKSDQTLSVVDPATLKVLGRIPSGPDPHEVVASSDGRVAYISNYNGGVNLITVIDLVAMKPMPPIDLGPLRAPHGLTFTGGKLWFTAEAAKAIGSYDPATSKVDWILGTGQNRTHMIFVSSDLSRIVTSNVSSATMTIIEKTAGGGRGGRGGPPPGTPDRGGAPPAATPGRSAGPGGRGGQMDWNEIVVPVGRGAEGFDVSPDGTQIWAANAQDGTVSIIDVASKTVTDTLAANVNGANRLKFTPDGKLVLVSTLGGPELAIIDAATKRDVKRLKIGRGAAGIEMQPDGARAFVACTPDDNVAVIDLKTLEVIARIEAGRQPDGLAWTTRR
jgi:YVTN family beta-propeller protein